jgi:UDP-2,3-diacylglucosamine pyrophosphatase LpxH
MNNTIKIGIAILVLLFVGIIFIDSNSPKPVDWSPTYSTKDKIPYGLYIAEKEIKSMFKDFKFENVDKTAYEYFSEEYSSVVVDSTVTYNEEQGYDYQDTINHYEDIDNTETDSIAEAATNSIDTSLPHENINYLSISQNSDVDTESFAKICAFVSKGNTVFFSANNFDSVIQDSLKIQINYKTNTPRKALNWFANPAFGNKKYNILQGADNTYFSKIDTLNTTVLGYQKFDDDSVRVNFIKIKYKKGSFLLHSQPVAFTNYHMLKEDHYEYVQKVFSYIPDGNFIASMKGESEKDREESRLKFWNSQPALRWAWYLFLIGMAIFMLFNAKRKQRIVPIIKPLTNTTVDFTKTIGNLYYMEGDHDNIINKKIVYFLERIRNEYLIDTTKLDDEFVKKLHQKSGKDTADIQKVVFLINKFRNSPHNSIEEDLIEINNAIEKIVH